MSKKLFTVTLPSGRKFDNVNVKFLPFVRKFPEIFESANDLNNAVIVAALAYSTDKGSGVQMQALANCAQDFLDSLKERGFEPDEV